MTRRRFQGGEFVIFDCHIDFLSYGDLVVVIVCGFDFLVGYGTRD